MTSPVYKVFVVKNTTMKGCYMFLPSSASCKDDIVYEPQPSKSATTNSVSTESYSQLHRERPTEMAVLLGENQAAPGSALDDTETNIEKPPLLGPMYPSHLSLLVDAIHK
jgi:hypothetical protein